MFVLRKQIVPTYGGLEPTALRCLDQDTACICTCSFDEDSEEAPQVAMIRANSRMNPRNEILK